MNHPTFLQWNCRGFKVNFNELSLLIQKYCPEALCLQETHLKETDKINIKKYRITIVMLKLIEPLEALP